MPSLKVWNVGHGEAMRIDIPEDKVFVIRDFGQMKSTSNKSNHQPIDNIKDELLKTETAGHIEAILSHAHYDHFNGFKQIYEGLKDKKRKPFYASYIPWLDIGTTKSLGYSICKVSAYLFAYHGANKEKADQYKNWFLAAPIMYALSDSLYGVAAGYTFNWGQAKVLWPPPPRALDVGTLALDLLEIADDLKEAFLSADIASKVDQIEAVSLELNKIIIQYQPSAGSNVDLPLNRIIVENNQQNIKKVEELFNQLAPIKPNQKKQIPSRVSSTCRTASRRLDQSIDDHSLVFEFPNKALFLSDLSPGCMDMMAQKYMVKKNDYEILKSAHHGTRIGGSAFKKHLSSVKTVVHCCGSSNKTFHAPSCKYCELPDVGKTGVRWTDTHVNKRECCKPSAFSGPFETFPF
jgi:beta-lactamase superfamily II metal-dependent hydrolase